MNRDRGKTRKEKLISRKIMEKKNDASSLRNLPTYLVFIQKKYIFNIENKTAFLRSLRPAMFCPLRAILHMVAHDNNF